MQAIKRGAILAWTRLLRLAPGARSRFPNMRRGSARVLSSDAYTVEFLSGSRRVTLSTGRPGKPEILGAHLDNVVESGDDDTYRLTFEGQRPARVAVVGDGDTGLSLFVYDEFDNEIVSVTEAGVSGSDQHVVEWTPRWTGEFTVKVVNPGLTTNCYTLLTCEAG